MRPNVDHQAQYNSSFDDYIEADSSFNEEQEYLNPSHQTRGTGYSPFGQNIPANNARRENNLQNNNVRAHFYINNTGRGNVNIRRESQQQRRPNNKPNK